MRHDEYLNIAHAAHENGARRHPRYWLKANHIVVDVLRKLEMTPHEPQNRALGATLALRLLDYLQPLGVIEEPTDENVKDVLERVNPKGATE